MNLRQRDFMYSLSIWFAKLPVEGETLLFRGKCTPLEIGDLGS